MGPRQGGPRLLSYTGLENRIALLPFNLMLGCATHLPAVSMTGFEEI